MQPQYCLFNNPLGFLLTLMAFLMMSSVDNLHQNHQRYCKYIFLESTVDLLP